MKENELNSIQKQSIFFRIRETSDMMNAMREGNPSIHIVNEIDRDTEELKHIRNATRLAHIEQLKDIDRRLLQIEQKYCLKQKRGPESRLCIESAYFKQNHLFLSSSHICLSIILQHDLQLFCAIRLIFSFPLATPWLLIQFMYPFLLHLYCYRSTHRLLYSILSNQPTIYLTLNSLLFIFSRRRTRAVIFTVVLMRVETLLVVK